MNATTTAAWPTLDEVELVIESWRQAYNDLDELMLRLHGLIDFDDPWESVEGAPVPTLSDAGVLARLVVELEADRNGSKPWLQQLRQLRDSATSLEAHARRGAALAS